MEQVELFLLVPLMFRISFHKHRNQQLCAGWGWHRRDLDRKCALGYNFDMQVTSKEVYCLEKKFQPTVFLKDFL